MTYSTLLDDDIVNQQYLIVIKPRRKLGSFALFSGSVYQTSFDYGEVVSVTINGEELVNGTSSALSASQYYWDSTSNVLYVRNAGGTDPSASFNVASYEIYLGTFDAHHNRVPSDAASRVVYYEPLIVKSPVINSSSSDNLFGFIPVLSTSLTLSNATHFFEKHIYDSSFNQASIQAYHWLGDLSVANVKLVLNGVINKISYGAKEITLTAFDKVSIFTDEYRNTASGASSFYDLTDFPNLNPQFLGRPIRAVYGMVDGFVPVNVEYSTAYPLVTTQNRAWIAMSGRLSENNITTAVKASPVSTTTRTYLTSVAGFQVSDSVILTHSLGPTTEGVIITAVGSDYIEHAAIGVAMLATDSVTRPAISQVVINQANITYQAKVIRDYNVLDTAGRTIGFTFTNTVQANLALPNPVSPNDRIHCRVYGKKNTVTLGGPAFGSDDSLTGSLTHPAVIMIDLLKAGLLVIEAEINTASFTSLLAATTEAVGFAIPSSSSQNFPTYKDLVSDILSSMLIKLYLDNDSLWTVSQLAPMTTPTKTIDDTEIIKGSFTYDFEYNDVISNALVEYAQREVPIEISRLGPTYLTVSSVNTNATYLHKVKRQKTFQSIHFKSADATQLANRLAFVLGERSGQASFDTKNRFFDSLLSDIITVSREALPGFDYVIGTENTRSFSVREIKKSLGGVTLSVDDQKGIEDNSGSW